MFLGHFCYWTLFVVTVIHNCALDSASDSITLCFLLNCICSVVLCVPVLYCKVSPYLIYGHISRAVFFFFLPLWFVDNPFLTHGFDYVHFVFDIWLMFLSGLIYNNWAGWILVSCSRSRTLSLGTAVDGHMAGCRFDPAYYLLVMTWYLCFRGHHAALACDVCCDHDCTLYMKVFKALYRPLTSQIVYFSQTTVMFI